MPTNDIVQESDGSLSKQVRVVGAAAGGTQVQGPVANDGVSTANPQVIGGVASAAAPSNVSADGDVVQAWLLRNGATASVLTAAGALIGGDAANGLDVDVTRVATRGYAAAVSVTRTNDTNVYAANDVLGPATGSTAGITFASMGPGAGEILITSVIFERDTTALISGETSYVLHLYSITPPSALGDNVAFDLPAGDRASYLGAINLGTPVDLGSTLYVEQNNINKQLTLAGTSLFGYLVTVGTYTPVGSAVHRITLHSVAV